MCSCEHGNEKFSKNISSQNFSYFVIFFILNTILRRKNNSIFKKAIFLLPSPTYIPEFVPLNSVCYSNQICYQK
jgi:hypothetical protein